MARAKRTDRADARRRYRQVQIGEVDGPEPTEAPPAPARGQRPAPATTERPSITAAFRNAYHRANIRDDIMALPWLLRSRAFLAAVGLVVLGTGAIAALPQNFISGMLFQALVYPPAMAPVFVVGFFAKRASYLLGLIISILDVAAFAFVIYVVAPAGATTTAITPEAQQQALYSAISVGPLSGIFFAAAAAWYRRFLALSNARPQQGRRQAGSRAGRTSRG